MSEWFEITDPDDVELSKDGKRIEIMFNTNEFGNQYVEVPIEFITRVLKESHEKDTEADYEIGAER